MKKKVGTFVGMLILLFTALFPAANVFAVGTLNVDVNVSSMMSSTLSGQDALYRMDFKVTGINTTYNNAKLTVNVPTGFSLDTTNMPLNSIAINGVTPVYDTTTNTLTYNLGTVSSGLDYSLVLKVATTNGSTPNGTSLTLAAKFTADNFDGNATDNASVTVTASNTISTSKTAASITDSSGKTISRPPATNDLINWQIKVADINKTTGLLYLKEGSNIVVVDTLPDGLTYVSDDSGGVYNASNNTVTWTFGAPTIAQQQAATGDLYNKTINVKTMISSTTNFSKLTNSVKATATDLNGTPVTNTSSASVSMGLSDPSAPEVPSGNIWALQHGANAAAGFYQTQWTQGSNPDPTLYNDQTWATAFNIRDNAANSQTKDMTSYVAYYSIDPHLNLSSLYVPSYVLAYDAANNPSTAMVGAQHPNMDIYITVNGTEYKAVTNATDLTTYQMSAIFTQLGLPQDSHVSNVRYNYNYAPAGMYASNMALNFTIQSGYVGKVTNTVVYKISGYNAAGQPVTIDTTSNSTNPSNAVGARTAEIVARPVPSPPVATSKISFDTNNNGVVNLGANRVTGNFGNINTSTSNMNGPFTAVVILPKGVTINTANPSYQLKSAIGNSWDSATTDGNNANGTVKILSTNYNSTGQEQILISWTSDSILQPGQALWYGFNVNIDSTASSPIQLYTFGSSSDTNLTVPTAPSKITDSFLLIDNGSDDIAKTADINNNGSSTDKLVKSGNQYTVLSNYGLNVQKQVQGNLDSGYSTFGHVSPGGIINYKIALTTRNPNQTLTNFVFVDVLPSVGDLGITDNAARGSQFTPILTGPISLPSSWNSHVTVYYSTAKNPSRSDLTANVVYPDTTTQLTDPSGVQTANWQTASQVTDWSQIHSYMIKQNTGDTWSNISNLIYTFTMQAPTVAQLISAGETNALATNVSGDPTSNPTNRAAWNSFAYQENTSQVIEPIKVGVAMENYTGDVYLLKFETGTTVDTDSDGKPDIDSNYHLTKGNPLAGAVFDLVDASGKTVGTATTDQYGQIHFSNVWYGDYTLVETKAPAGYELLKKPIPVTVSSSNNGVTVAFAGDSPQTILPSTGGDGSNQVPLIVASSLGLVGLITVGAGYLIQNKRKKGEENDVIE
ncbi:prealbumin-like fold domain-containing protein [Lactococcus allomyrinae]|uniref:SpaA-like prealbumin fold domain-containing protein n=1 Tax=Lactococcus allomyrinae TaxID=2419773 RepID=A0A387BF45_9LACT|nr:prealbumin-like fold domain-containing protein [Lactococcus allomyrinae]AYG00209.1 hypothetical protein D7I46_03375 [Lactococcus allomyrinae]